MRNSRALKDLTVRNFFNEEAKDKQIQEKEAKEVAELAASEAYEAERAKLRNQLHSFLEDAKVRYESFEDFAKSSDFGIYSDLCKDFYGTRSMASIYTW